MNPNYFLDTVKLEDSTKSKSGFPLENPLSVDPKFRKSPIQIAIDKGFQSLVELLITNERSQEVKNQALSQALAEKKLDLIQLLVNHGAEITSVPFSDVLRVWEPEIIHYFLNNGADIATGYPFAIAFKEKVRTALRPFVDHGKAHPEWRTALQDQADRALRHFAYEGDLKWVSLLLWAGADPRSVGPVLDDDDPESHTTALKEASYKGNLEVLKKFKVDPKRDNLTELLVCSSIFQSRDFIRYLNGLGVSLNDKPNGGSSVLQRHLCHLHFSSFDAQRENRLINKYELREALECIEELVQHGARWLPADRPEINDVRRSLLKCEPAVMIEIVKLFSRHKASPTDSLEQLLNTPAARSHLNTAGLKL